MKDPDDFPVRDEAVRDWHCADCNTNMTAEERDLIWMNDSCDFGWAPACCNCGSTELEQIDAWYSHMDNDIRYILAVCDRLFGEE